MTEADFKRLVKEGAIMSYEILETGYEGEVTEVKIRPWPAFNKITLSERLKHAYERIVRRKATSLPEL